MNVSDLRAKQIHALPVTGHDHHGAAVVTISRLELTGLIDDLLRARDRLRHIGRSCDTLSPQEFLNSCGDGLGEMPPATYAGECDPDRSLYELTKGIRPTGSIKRIDLTEARALGVIQEVNRQFFHPLGLALECIVQDDGRVSALGGIWDYRDDPEGMAFVDADLATDDARSKAAAIAQLRESKVAARRALFGSDSDVQEIP